MTSGGIEELLKGNEIDNFFAESVYKINQRLTSSRSLKVVTGALSKASKGYFVLVKDYILANKKNIIRSIDTCDLVLINGEGSIHHSRLTGIVLLAISSIAKDRGKLVHIVNSTFQQLSPIQLRELKRVDKIIVREIYSQHYLLGSGINSIVGADAAWIYLDKYFKNLKLSYNKKNNNILLTCGTDFNLNKLQNLLKVNKITNRDLDYLLIDDSDTKTLNILKSNLKIHSEIDEMEILNNPRLLTKKYGLIISGRHHISILSYFLGIPVLILPGNTFKLESTLYSLTGNKNNRPVTLKLKQIDKAIKDARSNFLPKNSKPF